MYCIENYKSIEKLYIKKSSYSVIFGDDTIFLKEVCEAIYSYFNEKKNSSEKKLYITDCRTGEKEKTSSIEVVYMESNDLDIELQLGSKTMLYSKLLNFFKEKFPLEPSLITLNSILDDFSLDTASESMQEDLARHSSYKVEFKFEDFTPSDIVKKIDFNFFQEKEEKQYEYISMLEKFKIKLSIFDSEDKNIEKIYIFYFPENNLSIEEIKELKEFLKNLSKNNKVIIATSSKYLLGQSLDSLNIIFDKKLINDVLEEDFINELIDEYPKIVEKSEVLIRLRDLIKKNILELVLKLKITNKKENDNFEFLYLDSEEDIFLIVYYLKKIKYSYKIDMEYKEHCVFSNYIKNNF